jgi:hypothetical protein
MRSQKTSNAGCPSGASDSKWTKNVDLTSCRELQRRNRLALLELRARTPFTLFLRPASRNQATGGSGFRVFA